ncbi:Rhodopirellula transposase family protein [mine drainage metagenome]|uniref:Rhodopirellula transposase family protein n=1 Tax=mine drainage metagenome TaxID=410659 RepID=T1BSN3_9ZZZZ
MDAPATRLLPTFLQSLNEAQARWFAGYEALSLGRGGLKVMHERTGLSRPTILKGIRELRTRDLPPAGRVRRPGGGRRTLESVDPTFRSAMEKILEETTAGDPMSQLRWTCRSTPQIARELSRQKHPVSAMTVDRKLREMGYSLQANAKEKEGKAPPERDAQFRYINAQAKRFLTRGEPVVSVDTKKKERVGEFKNPGQTWRPKGKPQEVNVYDYPDLGVGTASPYGVYDVGQNRGFVNVGMNHDTGEFAVESLRRWWRWIGRRQYPEAKEVLVCADGGGSNGYRLHAWKYFLQQWADDSRLSVTVCHYPRGTSKWNKIEHRMFSFISLTWRGIPLTSYETVVSLIGSVRTEKGLRVKAVLDRGEYEAGLKFSPAEMKTVNLTPHPTFPQWNYTIAPHKM